MATKKTSHLIFAESFMASSLRKTRVWNVLAGDRNHLGQVRWFAHWRRYCFYPEDKTLFDAGCLQKIAEFCEKQTANQKEDRRVEKENERIAELKKQPVSDPEKFIRCEWCGAEIPKGTGICDECIPF